MHRVDLLYVHNQYSSTEAFTKALSDAFNRRGVKTRLVDMESAYIHSHLHEIAMSPPDFTLSFSKISFPNDTLPCDYFCVPHLTYWIDGPIYAMSLLKSPLSCISVVDEFDFCCLQLQDKERIFFLPHAASVEDIHENHRPLDIVMIASYIDFEKIRASWDKRFSTEIACKMEQAATLALQDASLSLIAAMEQVFQGEASLPLYYEIETYCKGLDRFNLVMALKDFKVHIFGSHTGGKGWKKVLSGVSHIEVHAPVSYLESLAILEKSKIVLNSSPQFRHGSHERIFNGLSKKALVVTNENSYLRRYFGAHSGLLYYHPQKIDKLVAEVRMFLSDDNARRDAVERGYSIIKENHTWDHRVHSLGEYAALQCTE